MPTITIDNQTIEVPQGTTVLQAAAKLGIEIPTLCYLEGYEPNTSCMVCVVHVHGRASLAPACATEVTDGMVVDSETAHVRDARRTALELLLSDHAGDCFSPCQNACPAHMDVSEMIRQIAADDMAGALETVKRDIPLPATLGRICPAPCEPGCRRRELGGPVSICLLKRHVADVDLDAAASYVPPKQPATGKRVAIVGAGPSGLSTAYFLEVAGHACTIFDEHELPGGTLRYAIEAGRLPREVIDGEIQVIERLGVAFNMNARLGHDVQLDDLRRQFDAVVIATGGVDNDLLGSMGLKQTARGLHINMETYETNIPGVFAAGGAVRPSKLAIKSVAEGKAVAACVGQWLLGQPIQAPELGFSTKLGKIELDALQTFVDYVQNQGERIEPPGGKVEGFTREQAIEEAGRCVHCQCDAVGMCKLREYAIEYDADPKAFAGDIGRPVAMRVEHPYVIYEPGKCIACGLCVQVAEREGEDLGLTFVGRGFNVRIDVPFHEKMSAGLQRAARKCAEVCPTGAIEFRRDVDPKAWSLPVLQGA